MKNSTKNYTAAKQFLEVQLPMYQQQGSAALKMGLQNSLELDQALGHPHKSYPIIHIAGTNGKGSVAHMLAAVLQAAGYRVGLFTSPHYNDFRERAKINGQFIGKDAVAAFVANYEGLLLEVQPSFFEATMMMALDYFRSEKVDIAIIEAGVGGRLDATNIVQPILSVITNISLDHTDILGSTRTAIAAHKAGIIKKNTPIVIGQDDAETNSVFVAKATSENASWVFAPRRFKAIQKNMRLEGLVFDIYKINGIDNVNNKNEEGRPKYADLLLGIGGAYQQENLITALSCFEILNLNSVFKIREQNIYDGLENIQSLTSMIGRWQILQREPLVIVDSAHNLEGIKAIAEQLQQLQQSNELNYQKLWLIIGIVKGKDAHAFFKYLPKRNAEYYFVQLENPRSMDAFEVQKIARQNNIWGIVFPNVKGAVAAAKMFAGGNAALAKKHLIFVGGSSYTLAEMELYQSAD